MDFNPIMAHYLNSFEMKGEVILKSICNCVVPSQIVMSYYPNVMPIEQLPDEKKRDLKKTVIAMFPEKTPQELIQCCKIIHTMGILL